MSDPTQRQVDADIERSMDLFKRADVGEVMPLEPLPPKSILLALDGSSQDAAGVLMATQLSERLESEVSYIYVPPTEGQQLDEQIVQSLTDLGASAVAMEVSPADEPPPNYDQILAAAEQSGVDLVIAPCPFARDFESLGEDSTGTVVDVLTARLKVPFITIRRPDATGRDPSRHLRLILTGGNPAAEMAARRALGMLHPDGRLELLLLVEESFYANFKQVMQEIQPDKEFDWEDLEHALAKSYGKLHAGLQHASLDRGFTYELLIRHEGDVQPITPEDPVTHPALMVLAVVRGQHDSESEAQDFIRRSPHPVMISSIE